MKIIRKREFSVFQVAPVLAITFFPFIVFVWMYDTFETLIGFGKRLRRLFHHKKY